MKNKRIITWLTPIWFSLQGVFAIYCPLHVYCKGGLILYEMLVTGSILLLLSLLIVAKNRIIRKIAYFLLWVYSVPFCYVVFLYVGCAGNTDSFVLVFGTICIVNIVLLFRSRKNMWFHRGIEMKNRKNNIAFIE